MLDNFNYALVWGTSTKYNPQRVGKEHMLQDEDVLQVIVKTANQQKRDKNYNQRCRRTLTSTRRRRKHSRPKVALEYVKQLLAGLGLSEFLCVFPLREYMLLLRTLLCFLHHSRLNLAWHAQIRRTLRAGWYDRTTFQALRNSLQCPANIILESCQYTLPIVKLIDLCRRY